MSYPTELEIILIKQFRANLEDVLHTEEHRSDPFFLRWIRARDHDLHKAEDMLRISLKWRDECKVDTVLDAPFNSWFTTNFPFWLDGCDKQGRPMLELPVGAWDMRKVTDGKKSEFHSYIRFLFESVLQKIRDGNEIRRVKHGDWPNTQFTIIVDWKGYSYPQLMHWRSVQNIFKVASTYEAHYPEVLCKAYFINCPFIFSFVMGQLKKVLCPKTINKIQCFGGEEEWGPVVLEQIDKDQIGYLYGGSRGMNSSG